MKTYSGLKRQQGVGMTEVLIAMMLLGIAVIGFAALQVRALGSTNDATYRTQAMAIAQDMGERIRANTAALAKYQGVWTPSGTVDTSCETATCTPDSMATYDISNISALAAATLPNGQVARATCPGRSNNCIIVAWNTTTPSVGTAANSCAAPTGLYASADADCVIMETY